MSTTIDHLNISRELRDKAEAQLQAGTALSDRWSMGVDALRLLHEMSSNPDRAEDALKMLHELQVHQVELDLQHQEVAANEREIDKDLRLYRALYDYAPLAYFVVDHKGAVIQGNLAAAELLGISQDDLEGQRIDTFLSPQNRSQLFDLLQRVAQSGTSASCVGETGGGEQRSRHLRFLASNPPGHEHLLLACCEYGNAE